LKNQDKEIFENSCTKVFSYDTIKGVLDETGGTLQVRSRKAGDKIHVLSMGGGKKIKDYLIDGKVPRAERNIPLLICGGSVVWIMDGSNIVSDFYKADSATHTHIYISKEEH
jgi:tRNA(Ile)-lysidine synthase